MRLDHLLSKEEEVGGKERYIVQLSRITEIFLVAMRLRVTPVHIPNTMVKLQTADGTMLETAWESRRLPDLWAYSSAG